LRERVVILEQKLEQAYREKNEVSERLALVMTELAQYKVRLEFLEKENERLKNV
jgi:predicted nuclease with TOPRIM domain